MKKMVCKDCGRVFDDDELRAEKYWNYDLCCYNPTEYFCPYCGSDDFDEATECPLCGDYYDASDDVHVCEGCLCDEENIVNAIEYGADRTEDVEINGFVANMLSAEKINEILINYAKEHYTEYPSAITKYLEWDKPQFSEFLIERRGK